ncbi:relaxase/mobilization nuclease domain-containing protein [Pedobacter aquatilis]|uniref:relaxase/mobilization nuclease domain-containing protein n=1 Tax=Pedobacter aquatilis TaxID=351343 RepID=UPI002930CE59|nr:relaxase/mobilization nuclease domain-containing protein [Pedobacter aquatilis]
MSGKSIRGMLVYNEQKIKSGEAAILLASGFATDIDKLNLHQKTFRFQELTKLNSRSKTNAMHISLSFHKDDNLDNFKLQLIASEYMERIGMGDQPFIVYSHFDTAHPHIHIATTLIQTNGDRIKTEAIGRNKSEPARIYLEKKYQLIEAKGRKLEGTHYLRVAEYGSSSTKRQIANITKSVMQDYAYTSFEEFKAILSTYRIHADRGEKDSPMFHNKGLIYSIQDNDGSSVGIPFKASEFFQGATMKSLEKRYQSNDEKRKSFRADLKRRIDTVKDKYISITKLTFQKELAGNQIGLIYRENTSGMVYGLTFIDHKNRTVFNGSDLGKEYSAKALTEILGDKVQLKIYLKNSLPEKFPAQSKVDQTSVTQSLLQGLSIEDESEPIGLLGRRKKKKKGKQQFNDLGL